MRPWAEQVYGVLPEQVVGSSIKTKFEVRDGKAVLVRLPELNFIDDKEGKPVGINQHIGHRPIAAFGNSDGDRQMLEYATSGSGPGLGMLVLHDDKAREFAYGPANGLPDSHAARSVSRCTTRRSSGAGSSSACRKTGSAFSRPGISQRGPHQPPLARRRRTPAQRRAGRRAGAYVVASNASCRVTSRS